MADGSTLPGGVRTTCPYCGTGCGLRASVGDGRSLAVTGDEAHPANFGRICSKGAALGSTVGLEGRLLEPMVGGRAVSWDEATGLVARRFREVVVRHGPDAVAFYVSGQLLTEDYYAANKLMKGFIGSANIDTNSRLCMASAVAAHKQAFGQDLVPGCYEDLELADLAIFAGHNAAWTHPVLFGRMEAARARGQRQVVIDPRRTDTAEEADLHLPLAPQTDVRLWNGLLADLISRGAVDDGFLRGHVSGLADVKAALARDDQSLSAVAADCGLEPAGVQRFFDLFAATARTVTLFCMGVNQSAQGTAKASAIINAHLVTGRIGKPGACPFSVTGQPNAMGGREVGGMANMLAAHMDFDEPSRSRVARFWSAPKVASSPGLKAVDMFEAIGSGRIKAVWIMATNPAVSLPHAARAREALARCPFVVVSDCMAETDTMAFAQVKLPAQAWGEKDGTVTNSERCISRQRPLFASPGQARADWRIIAGVASAMGFADAFSWRSPAAVFREWARLTAYENTDRMLNLEPLVGLGDDAYDRLEPIQWPVRPGRGTPRLFTDGRFATPDGRARMIAVSPGKAAQTVDGAFPLSLNTGRVRDQWHTMTRTGLAPELSRRDPEPFIEIHPSDAEVRGIGHGTLARVTNGQGTIVAVARVTDRQRPGSLFMPMHWTDALAPSARANVLVGPHVDPLSGQPEFKHAPVRLSAYRETWRGFFLSRDAWERPRGSELIWRRSRRAACHLHMFAGRGDEHERSALRKTLTRRAPGEVIGFEDASVGATREAWVAAGRLDRVLFMTSAGRLPSPDWLAELFQQPLMTPEARISLLAGRPTEPRMEIGPQVCACLNVDARRIAAAIESGAMTEDAVGALTGAGTNCGSCRPEIRGMIRERGRPPRREVVDAA